MKKKYIILFASDIVLLCILTYMLLGDLYEKHNLLHEIAVAVGIVLSLFFAYLTYGKFENRINN